MKKTIALGLLAVLLLQLCGCGGVEQTGPSRNSGRKTNTGSATLSTTEAGTEAQTEETTGPAEETSSPVERTPMTEVPYILEPPAEACIFKEPDANSKFVQVFGHQGAYTVVEECYDENGDLWAKLKSGIGWTNVTDPFCGGPDAPLVVASYSSKQVLSGDYHLAGLYTNDEFRVNVTILAHETVYNVCIAQYDMMQEQPAGTLYTLDELTPEKPLVAHLTFPGDFSAFMVYYTDADGVRGSILLWQSMDDSNTVASFD